MTIRNVVAADVAAAGEGEGGNDEGAQAIESMSSLLQSSDPNTSQLSKRASPETSDVANDQQDKEVAQAKPVRGRKHRRRPVKNDAKNDEALNSEGATGSNSNPNQAASSNISTTNSSTLDGGEIAARHKSEYRACKNQHAVEKNRPQVPKLVQKSRTPMAV